MARAYLCAEDAGGCGALWTPHSGDRRPITRPEKCPWAWCPDCQLAGIPEEVA